MASRQIPIVCPGHTRPLAELQFISPTESTPQSTLLISACHDRHPMVRKASSGDWIGTFKGHKGAVWSAKLDPSGNLAATASGDFSVLVWDGITGQELASLGHAHIVKTVDFSPDSKCLCTGGHEGLLRVYDLMTILKDRTGDGKATLAIKQKEQGKVVITKSLWMNDDVILAAASDGKVRCWNANSAELDNRLLHTLSVGAEVRDMEFVKIRNASGTRDILTVAAGDTVSFFELHLSGTNSSVTLKSSLLKAHKMPIHFKDEGGATLHPSGSKFVAGGSDLWVRVFDFETGEELECNKGHHGPIRCLRYAPNGETYATGSEDGTIRLWKTDP